MRKIHVIIPAAGQGERLGGGLPKQYRPLAGKPVLRHSLEKFAKLSDLASLCVVIDPAHEKYFKSAATAIINCKFVFGATTRKQSVLNGLKTIKANDDDIILIHDAARPLVSKDDINALIDAMNDQDAATLAMPITDTLRRDEEIISRENLWALQTPQAFRYGILKKAHETMKGDFTDDTGLVSAMDIPVKLVQGSKTNIKITHPEDFAIAEKFFSFETRTGTGFDVHAFSTEPGRKLILCGIEIPHTQGLAGHSDADVGLHALTDAILGTIAGGDIGLHFPPSDNTFKNMDSRIFLERACEMLREKNGTIQNADLTIICERPKITPHRDAMQSKVAEILGVNKSRVNIKATTTEGLGFTGRGEGIAAQAIVTVKLAEGS